jgi:RHS repeat-associated protein
MRFLLGLALAALPASLAASVPLPDACPPGQVAVPISSAPGPVTITEDRLLRGTTCVPAAPPITPSSAYTPPVPVKREPIPFVHAGELRLVSLNPPSPTALAQTTSSRVIERTYDDFDRVKSELVPLEDGTSWQIRYTYWRDGLRKTMTDMVGRVTFYEYDGQARLSRVTANQGLPNEAVTTYEYWPDDLLKRIVAPNGVVTSYGYDLADRVTSILIEHGTATLASYAYTYDANGNRLSQTETNGGPPELTTYTYDARDQLTSVTYPGGSSVTYGYDDVGNRTSETARNPLGEVVSEKTAVFDAVNRLSSVTDAVDPSNDATFTYDANGNLTSKTTASGTESYLYDVRDLMVESRSGPAITARFAYDAFGRRYLKVGTDGVSSAVVRQYLYDQTSVLHELDSDGLEVAKYEYGGDRLLSLTRRDEGRRFYHQDALGSVVALSDDAGAVVARYHLDAWGRYRSPSELDASANRFGFTGYLFDQETDLYWAKARFYDPEYGRFTSQDSVLGDIDRPPSLHRYFYGHANPLRYVDPTGHAVIDTEALHSNELLSRLREYNPNDGKVYRESICGGDRTCIRPEKPDSRVQAILRESGGDKAKAYQRVLEMKAAGQSGAAAITIEESDFDVHGNLDASKVYGQFVGQVGGHSAEIEDLREAFLASISGAQAGEVRDLSFLYNVAHEYSALRAYQLADEDARSNFGPDFIQRNAHLLGGAGPQDVRIEAGAALAMDTVGAASLGLGIYRAGASLARSAGAKSAAPAPDAFQATLRKVETLDFHTGQSRAVFYSGPGQGARAQAFAERTGRQTIEMTPGGRALAADPVFQSLSPNEQFLVWQRASTPFARGASGEVTAFLKGARPERTFRAIEEHILRANTNVYKYNYKY